MKRIIFLLLLTVLSIGTKAQAMYEEDENPVKLGWNQSLAFGLGYDHLHTPLSGDEYCELMPKHLFSINAQIMAVYIGIDYASRNTRQGGYGYRENVSTMSAKIGPSFRYGKKGNSVSLTPYIGRISCDVSIKVGSADIEVPGNHRTHGFLYGARLAYTYRYIEAAVNYSNHKIGFAIAAKVDF